MYNLDIANLDNFYVGEYGWLVHNCNVVMRNLENLLPFQGRSSGNFLQKESIGNFDNATGDFYRILQAEGIDPSTVRLINEVDGREILLAQLPDGSMLKVRNQGGAMTDGFNAVIEQVVKVNGQEIPIIKVRYK